MAICPTMSYLIRQEEAAKECKAAADNDELLLHCAHKVNLAIIAANEHLSECGICTWKHRESAA